MPLYKRKPFALLEKPTDLNPNEEVFQVRFTKEIFRDYGDYLKRMNMYQQRVWSCKLSGRNCLTYEEALLSEKESGEELQLFPKELLAPVLRDLQFSMLSLNDLVNTIAIKLQGRLSVGSNLYGRKNGSIHNCRILKVVEEDGKTQYEVEWMDIYDNKESEITFVKEEELIRKKMPYIRGVLKVLIRESTYRSIPWVLHDKLADEHEIPTHPPPELENKISLKDGLVVVNKKRKNGETIQTDLVIDRENNGWTDPKRKNFIRKISNALTTAETENENLDVVSVRYPIDDLLVQPSESDKQLTERPSPSRDFHAPMHCVGDLLMVWEFCTTFGKFLQLSPFSLEDFENAVCHSDSNVVLIVESHAALLRVLMNDHVGYFFTIQKKKRKSKITLITWTEYLCDFLEMIGIAKLCAHISTIKRGHYGLLDVSIKLKILGELVAQTFMLGLFKEKLDEDIEKRQALAAARRDEALEDGRNRREEKERSNHLPALNIGGEVHIKAINHNRKNGALSNEEKENGTSSNSKHLSEDSEGEQADTLRNDIKKKSNVKDAAESSNNSSKKAVFKNGIKKVMQKHSKDQKQRVAHKLLKNQIKETLESRSKEQRKEYLDREIEKRIIRTSPLGKDRDHNRYWFFRRESRIFVESSDSTQWGYYSSKEELDALIGSLNVKGVRERALKKQLEKFYDKIILEIQKTSKEATHGSGKEDSVVRRSTRVRAPPGENPALAFLKYANLWKEEKSTKKKSRTFDGIPRTTNTHTDQEKI